MNLCGIWSLNILIGLKWFVGCGFLLNRKFGHHGKCRFKQFEKGPISNRFKHLHWEKKRITLRCGVVEFEDGSKNDKIG
jgi:hypothetical protein